MAAPYELSTAQLRQALQLREQIESLQTKLNVILGGTGSLSVASSKTKSTAGKTKGKRTMSAEARAKIGAAAKARWAKTRATAAPVTKGSPSSRKKKSGMTSEGRAKISAAMKARWAARKKGAPAPNSAAA